MSTIFNITEDKMKDTFSTFTLTEIYQQPATWKKTCAQIREHKDEIKKFIDQVITCDDFDVILTGAGTSEFVGNALFPHLAGLLDHKAKSYGTTDIVATPEAYLSRTKPTLLISFGRSGNSPESVGAVDAAEAVCDNVYHLFVTCNKNGALSKRAATTENCYAINLTDETHDQSFAMTSSYSNMYLATLLCFHLDELDETIAKRTRSSQRDRHSLTISTAWLRRSLTSMISSASSLPWKQYSERHIPGVCTQDA